MDLDRFGFALTDEQRELREGVAAFASAELAPGANARDQAHVYPVEVIQQMAEMALMAIKVPLEYGGAGSDNIGYVLALEALAEADVSCAVITGAANLVSNILAEHGSDYQRDRFLRGCGEGRYGALAFCLSEPGAGSDAAALEATATKKGDGWVLNGSKMWITSGQNAGLYMVFATTDKSMGGKGIAAFVIEAGTDGLVPGKAEEKMGQCASVTSMVHLEDCYVPDDQMVGGIGSGYGKALQSLTAGRAGIAGLCIGIGEAALREGMAFGSERKAFGKRVTDFQNSQFVLADCRTQLDAAWLLTLRAATLLDRGDKAAMECSMAKLYASEASDKVCDLMLQMHGGYGYSQEYAIERLYRDSRVTRIYEGTSEIQRMIIGRQLMRNFAG